MRKVLLLSDRAEDDQAVRQACAACALALEPTTGHRKDEEPPLAIFFDAANPALLEDRAKAFKVGLVDPPIASVDLFSSAFDNAVWFLRPLDPIRIEHCLRYLLTQISCGDALQVTLDTKSRLVTIYNQPTQLTAPQAKVLLAFAKNGPNAIVQFEWFEDAAHLLPSISFLRTLFAEVGFHDAITTVPKVGYRLRSDILITY